jgi:hypothetical protein
MLIKSGDDGSPASQLKKCGRFQVSFRIFSGQFQADGFLS